ncbi:hypothetical protein HUG20_16845 [Salicibibacter cibi]|uniref:Uncharacterized protein n=1 Tax=Salicibibacter cibi TaxID=2743001 RepID=A0A7T6ZDI8_9BACI|nr:hypothetical protein [Salicibibacter cibi]QQK81412.1 hypothetical protein HUG20_16845 [Salicibibacter cibi]
MNKFWDVMAILSSIFLGVFIFLGFVTPDVLNDIAQNNLLFFVGSITLMLFGLLGVNRRYTEDKKVTFKMAVKSLIGLAFVITVASIVHWIFGL